MVVQVMLWDIGVAERGCYFVLFLCYFCAIFCYSGHLDFLVRLKGGAIFCYSGVVSHTRYAQRTVPTTYPSRQPPPKLAAQRDEQMRTSPQQRCSGKVFLVEARQGTANTTALYTLCQVRDG